MTTVTDIQITARHELQLERAGHWTITEFDGGARYMLTVAADGIQFSVHLRAHEWAQLQKLVSP